MGHSANTFRERAAACEALKRYVSDERAIEQLDQLIAEEVANARELEAFGAARSSVFAGAFDCAQPKAALAIVLSEPPIN